MSVAQPRLDFKKLKKTLASDKQKQLYKNIVNAPFDQTVDAAFLFLGFISLYVVDKSVQTIKLVASSDTEYYDRAISGYNFDPDNYRLSLKNATDNDIVKAYLTGKKQVTLDWANLSRKPENESEARLNQANSGIACSVAYPLAAPANGVLIFFYYQYEENIDDNQYTFMDEYVKMVSAILAKR